MESSKIIFGRIIKRLRKRKGLTQNALADQLDIDKQYVWKLENGKKNISADYLDRVIEKLGCRHDEFFNEIKDGHE